MLPYPHVHGALLQVDVPEHAHAEGVDDQVGVPLNSRRCTGRHRSPSLGSSEFVVHVLFIVKVLFIVQNKREEQEKNTNTNTNATSRPLAAPTQARPRERARPSVPPDDPARPATYVRTPRPDPTRPAPTRLTDSANKPLRACILFSVPSHHVLHFVYRIERVGHGQSRTMIIPVRYARTHARTNEQSVEFQLEFLPGASISEFTLSSLSTQQPSLQVLHLRQGHR